ncbi:quinon protein alcohol dehydrogenase-like superfamily [Mycena maculata]|uniref:Quinon protein alcohol dehydrogenase-like superfamily n=1 Tax=Mycena maculata TaxID=230809 RepID=A0AAD7N238_9AGAR|nr:quinon protein alcohol dehydrogenase-like superfamily [Mycena maculata]
MRTQHSPHFLTAFPVYSSAFLSPTHLVLGGGGGASRTGIKNKLRVYEVGDNRSITLVDELELERGEDAPMSMATNLEAGNAGTLACGVNSPEDKLTKGENENCRVYAFKEQKLGLLRTHGTLVSGDLDDFQKVTVLSPDGKLLVAAGTNSFQLLTFPSLAPAAQAVKTDKEIYDVSFSQNTIVVATTDNLLVYALPGAESEGSPSKNKKKGKQRAAVLAELELLRTVDPPAAVSGATGSNFRAARYHPENSEILYTISNTIPARSRTKKAAPRHAFVCKWDTKTWAVVKVKKVGDKGLTAFDVSPNGNLLAFGSSDYSVGLLDAKTLAPLITILKAHEFPPTTLKFNPTSRLLVSGSADNTIRVISVPDSTGKSSWLTLIILLITILIVLLAFAAQQYLGKL